MIITPVKKLNLKLYDDEVSCFTYTHDVIKELYDEMCSNECNAISTDEKDILLDELDTVIDVLDYLATNYELIAYHRDNDIE